MLSRMRIYNSDGVTPFVFLSWRHPVFLISVVIGGGIFVNFFFFYIMQYFHDYVDFHIAGIVTRLSENIFITENF